MASSESPAETVSRSVRDQLRAGGLNEVEAELAEYLYACGMCDYMIKELLVGKWVDVMGLEVGMCMKRAVETARGTTALKAVGEVLSAFERHGQKVRLQPLLHFLVLELALRKPLRKKERAGIPEGQRTHFSFLVNELVQRGLSDVQWSAVLPLDDNDCPWVMSWLAAIEFFLMHTVNTPQAMNQEKHARVVQCVQWLVYTAAAGDMVDTVAASHVLPHALVGVLVLPPQELAEAVARDAVKVALAAAERMDTAAALYTRWLAVAVTAVRCVRDVVPAVSFSAADRAAVRTTASVNRHLTVAVSRALDHLRLVMRQGNDDAQSRARALGAFDALLEYKALTGLDCVEPKSAGRVVLLTPPLGPVVHVEGVRLVLRRMFARALVYDSSWILQLTTPLQDMVLELIALIVGTKRNKQHKCMLDGELCALVVSMWDFAMLLRQKHVNRPRPGNAEVARFLMRVQRVQRAAVEVTLGAAGDGVCVRNVAELLPCAPRRTECDFCCGALDTDRSFLAVGAGSTRCSALCEALLLASQPFRA